MLAFIIAGVVVLVTFGLAALQAFAAGMSDVTNAPSGAGWTLGIGLTLAAMIAASHWLPPIGW